MKRLNSITRPLMWLMALALAAAVAGCGGGSVNASGVVASSAKAITAYSLAGNTGTINETAKTIAVTVPFSTNVTALVATFTASTGASVKIGAVVQTSGTTPNDFTAAKAYIVTAADGSMATYTVTVTVALNSAKAITAYSLAVGITGVSGTISEVAKTIAVTVPFGTNVTAMVATFTTTGASVKIGTVVQNSGAIPTNDFTAAKAYIVTAADGTMATYTVTVTVALNTAKAITAYSFVGYTATGVINETAPKTIAVTLPNGANVTALVANFTTTGASVKIGTVVQNSGAVPTNNFTSAKVYTVTAADNSTATYTVTVTVAAAAGPVVCTTGATNCVDLGTAANYVIFGTSGITNVPTSTVTGDLGTAAAASTITGFTLIADSTNVFSTSTQVTGKVYAVDYAAPTPTVVGTASNDVLTAYTAANAVGGGAGVGTACPGGGNFSGLAIAPGVYTCGGVTIPTNFTLAGTGAATDVWVFKLSGTLGMTGGSGMTFTGIQGALPQNVFWAVAGAVSIGAGSTLEGVVLGATNVDVLAGGIVHGRLLAQTAVNLQGGTNVVTKP